MAYSTRITHSDLVRMQHDDLSKIVREAKLLTGDALEAERASATAADRVMLKHYEDIGDEEGVDLVKATIASTEAMYADRQKPSWTLWDAKGAGRESLSAEVDEIVSRLGVPKPYRRVAVTIGTQSKKISIGIGDSGTSIDVDSNDEAWALQTSLWAQQRVAEITPRYSWLVSTWTRWMFVVLGLLAAVGVTFALRDLSGAVTLLAPLVFLIVALGGVAITFMPAAILSATRRAPASQFLQQLAWAVTGAVFGVAASELWRMLTAPPVP